MCAKSTHIHQTETVTTMSHSPQAGMTKTVESENNVDPNEVAELDPHYLPFSLTIPNTI